MEPYRASVSSILQELQELKSKPIKSYTPPKPTSHGITRLNPSSTDLKSVLSSGVSPGTDSRAEMQSSSPKVSAMAPIFMDIFASDGNDKRSSASSKRSRPSSGKSSLPTVACSPELASSRVSSSAPSNLTKSPPRFIEEVLRSSPSTPLSGSVSTPRTPIVSVSIVDQVQDSSFYPSNGNILVPNNTRPSSCASLCSLKDKEEPICASYSEPVSNDDVPLVSRVSIEPSPQLLPLLMKPFRQPCSPHLSVLPTAPAIPSAATSLVLPDTTCAPIPVIPSEVTTTTTTTLITTPTSGVSCQYISDSVVSGGIDPITVDSITVHPIIPDPMSLDPIIPDPIIPDPIPVPSSRTPTFTSPTPMMEPNEHTHALPPILPSMNLLPPSTSPFTTEYTSTPPLLPTNPVSTTGNPLDSGTQPSFPGTRPSHPFSRLYSHQRSTSLASVYSHSEESVETNGTFETNGTSLQSSIVTNTTATTTCTMLPVYGDI